MLRAHELHRALAQQVGEVAVTLHFGLVLPQIMFAAARAVGEIIDAAGHRAEEGVVAAFLGAEMRAEAEVPFADQRGGVAGVAQ